VTDNGQAHKPTDRYQDEARAIYRLFCRIPNQDDVLAALADWLRARDGNDAR